MKDPLALGLDALRRRAEEHLRKSIPAAGESDSPSQLNRVVHELLVHQIELEMQNEELKAALAEGERLRNRYSDFYDFSPTGFVSLNREGEILQINLVGAQMLGHARMRLVGARMGSFLGQEGRQGLQSLVAQLFEGGPRCSIELSLASQGSSRAIHLDGTLSSDQQECRVVLVDVTEQRRDLEERRALERKLFEAQKLEALGILVSGVAHNLNNVLAAIMATSSVQETLTEATRDLEAYRIITLACRRGRDVVRSLTQFAKPVIEDPGPLELHTLVSEVRILLESAARNRVRIEEAFAGEPLWISADPGSLNHSLVNLCLNALDAMPAGGTLTLRTSAAEAGWIRLDLEDTGAGMTPEVLAHAAEPFFTTKEVGKGTGLGLSMAYGVVRAHGGTLELESAPGQGTTVRLRFPRIPAPVAERPAPAPAPILGPLSVLLVDDDEDVRFLVARMLSRAGLRVETEPGGEEALERLGAGPLPDLIILDQNMPRMDGLQTLERIRSLHPELPVLICSGQPQVEEWPSFRQPHTEVLSKPFELDELLAKLVKVLPASPRP